MPCCVVWALSAIKETVCRCSQCCVLVAESVPMTAVPIPTYTPRKPIWWVLQKFIAEPCSPYCAPFPSWSSRYPTIGRASAPRPVRCDGSGELGKRTAAETGALDGGYLGCPGRLYHGAWSVYLDRRGVLAPPSPLWPGSMISLSSSRGLFSCVPPPRCP